MFEIRCIDSELLKKLKNPEQHFPPSVCQELPQFLNALEQNGDISRTDFFLGNINGVSANTFHLHYLSNSLLKIVVVIDFKVKDKDMFKDRFSTTNDWNDQDVLECIPQYDKPAKIIQALELINKGIIDPYEIGKKLGHQAKKERDVARHGQYAQKTLEELKLIFRIQQGRKLVPKVTDRGKRIAEAPDHETQEILLISAMLAYKPVWKVVGAVTEEMKKLDNELVQQLVFPPEFQEAATSGRRAQTLRKWVEWIRKYQLLPISLGDGVVQLPLPMLFSSAGAMENKNDVEEQSL